MLGSVLILATASAYNVGKSNCGLRSSLSGFGVSGRELDAATAGSVDWIGEAVRAVTGKLGTLGGVAIVSIGDIVGTGLLTWLPRTLHTSSKRT
jgi:hypothetical protein